MSSPDDLVQADIDGQIVTMPRSMSDLLGKPPIALTIDGKKVEVPLVSVTPDPKGKAVPRLTTIYDAGLESRRPDPDPLPPRIHEPGGRLPRLLRPRRL